MFLWLFHIAPMEERKQNFSYKAVVQICCGFYGLLKVENKVMLLIYFRIEQSKGMNLIFFILVKCLTSFTDKPLIHPIDL